MATIKRYATEDYVDALFERLSTNATLGFYCIEDVTIVINGVSTVYSANSNAEIKLTGSDIFEIIPTSDNSILSLTAFPGALGTYFSWLEGVKQFSNILFDMNNEDMYTKWSQGQQGMYNVQSAQYLNCIFWSDNPYINDVNKRTNYTLTHTSQLPLCYSSIPDNTFKAFYLADGVISDPNWANQAYLDSFAKATWATQVFSYYGARTIGRPELFNIVLPKDCRGLMFYARNVENAGTFDATNVTNFGAKSGSWREAFGYCSSLRRLYISNLKVSLNISWSPIDYDSIYFIISEAANTSAITISVSPYTYHLLSPSDFELAASKNITIALLAGNYVEDNRFNIVAYTTGDGEFSGDVIANGNGGTSPISLTSVYDSLAEKQNKNIIVTRGDDGKATLTASEIIELVRNGNDVFYSTGIPGGTLHSYLEGSDTAALFYSSYIDDTKIMGTGISVSADGTITTESYESTHLTNTDIHITAAERENWNNKADKDYVDSKLPAEFDAIILRSANKKFTLTVNDQGILTTTEIISEEV